MGSRRLTQPPLILILLLVGSWCPASATLWSSGSFLLPSTRYPQWDGQLGILQIPAKNSGKTGYKTWIYQEKVFLLLIVVTTCYYHNSHLLLCMFFHISRYTDNNPEVYFFSSFLYIYILLQCRSIIVQCHLPRLGNPDLEMIYLLKGPYSSCCIFMWLVVNSTQKANDCVEPECNIRAKLKHCKYF